jgi:hypothetical protein
MPPVYLTGGAGTHFDMFGKDKIWKKDKIIAFISKSIYIIYRFFL